MNFKIFFYKSFKCIIVNNKKIFILRNFDKCCLLDNLFSHISERKSAEFYILKITFQVLTTKIDIVLQLTFAFIFFKFKNVIRGFGHKIAKFPHCAM